MTSIAVTASRCASASEVALQVACFMCDYLPRLGRDLSLRAVRARPSLMNSEYPSTGSRLIESPIGDTDCLRVEQYCGGNLTRAWPAADSVLSK